MEPCIPDRIGVLEVLVFMEGGKPENPEKNPRSKDENQQQTQPTYITIISGVKEIQDTSVLLENIRINVCHLLCLRFFSFIRTSRLRLNNFKNMLRTYPGGAVA